MKSNMMLDIALDSYRHGRPIWISSATRKHAIREFAAKEKVIHMFEIANATKDMWKTWAHTGRWQRPA